MSTDIRKWLRTHDLLLVVFVTGAAVLVVEVTAVRILSTYFGNTIYTVSGVIAVVLAALSLGYAHGGVRADKMPTRHEFFRTIEKGGIALAALFFLVVTFAPLALLLPLSWGPLIASLILFFAPSYFLGMLSPFAIKLGELENPQVGTGTISGRVFFWSTCGSLLGTLSTSFILIPQFGLNTIIFGTTLCVLLIGSVGSRVEDTGPSRHKRWVPLAFLLIILCAVYYFSAYTPPGVVFSKDGVYQHMTIRDGTFAGRPARFFYQDRATDDIKFLDGNDLAAPYTRYYALYKLFQPTLARALFIGGGMYSMPSALHRDLPQAQIDVAEIEPSLFELAQKYFDIPNDPHLVNHIEDGRHFLERSNVVYDMIFSDVYYSLYSIPPAYTTKEFFSEVRKKLSPNGIFIANFIGSLAPEKPSLILSEVRTLQEVFPQLYLFAVDSPSTQNTQNLIMLAVNSDLATSPLPKSIPAPLPQDIRAHLVPLERYNLDEYPIFTDNYAPVEYMTAKILTR